MLCPTVFPLIAILALLLVSTVHAESGAAKSTCVTLFFNEYRYNK